MVSERDVVGLLHRADWTKLSLTGTVTGAEPVVDTIISVQLDEPPSGPWKREDADDDSGLPPSLHAIFGHLPPWIFEHLRDQARETLRGRASGASWDFEPRGQDAAGTLSVAPGQRFRADGTDGTWAIGCDGTRMWYWFRDRPAGAPVSFGFTGGDGTPRAPYAALLAPAWLLTGYALVLDGEETVAGRTGVRVRGTLRPAAAETHWIGGPIGQSEHAYGLFAPLPRWVRSTTAAPDEVAAVVDPELGILLRCSQRSGDNPPTVTGFLSLDVTGPASASAFTAPAGSAFAGDRGARTRSAAGRADAGAGRAAGTSLGDALGEALEAAGREAAKAAGGLAAGGLGALIRYAPRRQRVDPFARATAEAADPEAEMPADEPAPDGAGGQASAAQNHAPPDEVLRVVYRSGLAGPRFSATLHEWFDGGAMLSAVPESARGAGFGGVGFLVDAIRDVAQEAAARAGHQVSTVRMGGWNEYRIDFVRSVADAAASGSGKRKNNQVRTIASDGTRQWRVFDGQVVTGSAGPPPSHLVDLVDASWLLGADLSLSGGTEVWLGPRRAYRITARYRDGAPPGVGWWERLFFPAVAVVDAETGLVLRLTRFKGGRPAIRQELRDVAALDAGADFGFTPPAGVPVMDPRSGPDDSKSGSGPTWSWGSPR